MVVVESSLLSDVSYVLCLDSLGTGEDLYLHVSKPPRDSGAGDILLKVSLLMLIQSVCYRH